MDEAEFQKKMNEHQNRCKLCYEGKNCGTLVRIGRKFIFGK